MRKLVVMVIMLAVLASMVAAIPVLGEEELSPVRFVAVLNTASEDLDTNDWLNNLAAESGLAIEWTSVRSGWGEKLAAQLAGGEVYDGYVGWNVIDKNDVILNSDLFMPLSKLIAENAPLIQNVLDNDTYMYSNMVTNEGEIYYITNRQPFRPQTTYAIVVYKPWLDQLEMDIPENITEFEDMLRAFRDNDMNGNGDPNDELPLYSTINRYTGPGIGGMMGAFGVKTSTDTAFFAEDGKLTFAPITDNFKEYVKWMSRMREEGLIAEEVATASSNTDVYYGRLGSTLPLVGVTTVWESWPLDISVSDDYVAISPVAGLDGTRFICANPVTLAYDSSPMFVMGATNPAPEKTIAFMDRFFDPVNAVQINYGPIGVTLDVRDDGVIYMKDPPEGMDWDTWEYKYSVNGGFAFYVPEDWTGMEPPKAAAHKLEMDTANTPYIDLDGTVPPLSFTIEQIEELSIIQTDIDTHIRSKMAEWFLGRTDIDTEWDSYLQELNNMGLERYIEIYQEAYDAL